MASFVKFVVCVHTFLFSSDQYICHCSSYKLSSIYTNCDIVSQCRGWYMLQMGWIEINRVIWGSYKHFIVPAQWYHHDHLKMTNLVTRLQASWQLCYCDIAPSVNTAMSHPLRRKAMFTKYNRRDATVMTDATAWSRGVKYRRTVYTTRRYVAGRLPGDINNPLVDQL